MEQAGKNQKIYSTLIYCLLGLITLTTFAQVRYNDFLNYDDEIYVTKNNPVKAGLTSQSILWAFTAPRAGFWHPLTMLSHMLDCELFGLNPRWHHLTNLFLHTTNTLLLFKVFKNMTGQLGRSAFVAFAFALHPLHVESVAWVAERKDVLSTLFWILTMIAYSRYIRHPSAVRYFLILLYFTLGLMAKPMLVTLPFVLLLLDYWPLDRFENRRDIKISNSKILARLTLEKVPLFTLAVGFSILALFSQQQRHALTSFTRLPFMLRVANAFLSYMMYIKKMVWPTGLVAFYPHPVFELSVWKAAVSALLLMSFSVWAIYLARSHKYLIVGWLWYLGTLFPVIGLVQVGSFAMADRYTYVPLTGLFVIIAWGLDNITAKWRYHKPIMTISGVAIILALSVFTSIQLRYWRNSITLFEHTLKVIGNNTAVHYNIAAALEQKGRTNDAVSHYRQAFGLSPDSNDFQEAMRQKPDSTSIHSYLGDVLLMQGRFSRAAGEYSKSLHLKPNDAEVHYKLASILESEGETAEAMKHYGQALPPKVDWAELNYKLGQILAEQGKLDNAIRQYRRALKLKPDYIQAYNELGIALTKTGRANEGSGCFLKALRIEPNSPEIHNNLGIALATEGKFDEAVSHYHQAIKLRPDWPLPLNGTASILATHPDPNMRNARLAIELAERAVVMTEYKNAIILNTLASAYAAAGRFSEATATAQKAFNLAVADRNDQLADFIRRQLEMYKQGKFTKQ